MSNSVFVEQKYLLPNNLSSVMFQINNYCFVNQFDLSKGEMCVLANYYLDGISEGTDEKIIKSGVFSNYHSLKNVRVKLNKLNIIYKKNKSYLINNFMNIAVGDKVAILIKAGNR